MERKYLYLVTVAPLLLILDQASKYWIRNTIFETGPQEVIAGFFRLVHVENPGAAWGFLSDAEHRIPFFVVTTLLAFVVIGIYFWKLPRNQPLMAIALSCILSGALGNFVDRVRFQSVTDFLDFYVGIRPLSTWLIQAFGTNRWPSFNVADMAIVLGLGLILYDMLKLEPARMRAAQQAEQESEGRGTSPGEARTLTEGGVR